MDNDLYMSDERHRTIEGWRASLDIFERHGKTNSWLIDGAEHDIFYTCYDSEEIPENSEDGRTLISLGWHVTEDGDWACFA